MTCEASCSIAPDRPEAQCVPLPYFFDRLPLCMDAAEANLHAPRSHFLQHSKYSHISIQAHNARSTNAERGQLVPEGFTFRPVFFGCLSVQMSHADYDFVSGAHALV